MPAPRQYLPRKSSAHRIACIALYRALLKQCPRIPLPDDVPLRGKTNPLTHFVQKEFRKNVYHTSPKLILSALQTGYATHSLLLHASSSPNTNPNPSLTQLHTLLRTLSTSYTTSKITLQPYLKPTHTPAKAYPGAPKTVSIRPLSKEKLTGRRHVPKLIAVHNIFPFLQFKKPQSRYLSRVLNQKVKRKLKRFTRINELEGEVEMGRLEDEWDGIVEQKIGEGNRDGKGEDIWSGWEGNGNGKGKGEGSWKRAFVDEGKDLWEKIRKEGKRGKELAEKMTAIIEEEKRLAEEERRERKHLKNVERMRRKMERVSLERSTKS